MREKGTALKGARKKKILGWNILREGGKA